MSDLPLIVQGDHTVLVEVASPRYAEARDALARFAELVKMPEHVHSYRITPLSIWNACAAGMAVPEIVEVLVRLSRFPVPPHVLAEISDYAARFGQVTIERCPPSLVPRQSDDPRGWLLVTIASEQVALVLQYGGQTGAFLEVAVAPQQYLIAAHQRGPLKRALVRAGYPANDVAGYTEGEPLPTRLRTTTVAGAPFALRDYQQVAATAFHERGSPRGGSGVVTLPCGAGKTVVAMAIMAETQRHTLILTTGVTAARQWRRELLDKTSLAEHDVGEYDGTAPSIRPVTVATYQMLTHRQRADGPLPHMQLFEAANWGLIVYDEVHVLPAPVFQMTASLQARRRLGLTATLVREDGCEEEVFALIGPRKADVPWKVLERQGWIARAVCTEVRVPLPAALELPYAIADARSRFRIASESEAKAAVVRRILGEHASEPALIIGTYVEQLQTLARTLDAPCLTGSTSQRTRDTLFAAFREGRLPVLVVSKVANFAIDLPDAALAVQVSGTFGSRQEEAQRLGRILRPKGGANQAHFYNVVSAGTVEEEFALKRQLFLCEQGYEYHIRDAASSMLRPHPVRLERSS